MTHPQSIDTPLIVQVENGELVIRIGIKTLAWAAERQPDWNPYDYEKKDWVQLYWIADPLEFAKDVKCELLREEEDGSTPLGNLLDKVCTAAKDDGSIAVSDTPYCTENPQ